MSLTLRHWRYSEIFFLRLLFFELLLDLLNPFPAPVLNSLVDHRTRIPIIKVVHGVIRRALNPIEDVFVFLKLKLKLRKICGFSRDFGLLNFLSNDNFLLNDRHMRFYFFEFICQNFFSKLSILFFI